MNKNMNININNNGLNMNTDYNTLVSDSNNSIGDVNSKNSERSDIDISFGYSEENTYQQDGRYNAYNQYNNQYNNQYTSNSDVPTVPPPGFDAPSGMCIPYSASLLIPQNIPRNTLSNSTIPMPPGLPMGPPGSGCQRKTCNLAKSTAGLSSIMTHSCFGKIRSDLRMAARIPALSQD